MTVKELINKLSEYNLEAEINVVVDVLEKNIRARQDDFILYGAVLKRLGVDLKQSMCEFLANARINKMPSFETVTRCTRHSQELK